MRSTQLVIISGAILASTVLAAQLASKAKNETENASLIKGGYAPVAYARQSALQKRCDEGGCNATLQAQSDSGELYDYLVQDVCVDNSNVAILGDPATCYSHRNINVGESSPYIVTDFERSGENTVLTYEGVNSLPVKGTDGSIKILITKSLQGNFRQDYSFNWNQSRDGYDLIDLIYAPYASYVRTSDPGCQDQIWSRTANGTSMAQRAGGWILFPTSSAPSAWPLSSSVNVTTYHIQVTPGRPGCSNGSSTGVTYWNKPTSYTFEARKTLTAIRSFHFAAKNLSQQNNAMEKYYFTREYGFTRWESWVPQSRCFAERGGNAAICRPEAAEYPLRGRCNVLNTNSSSYPGLDVFGNQRWVMIDCRDHSNLISLNSPQLMLDDVVAQNDGYKDIYR